MMKEKEQDINAWLKEQEKHFSPSTEQEEFSPTAEEIAETNRKYDPRCLEKFAGASAFISDEEV